MVEAWVQEQRIEVDKLKERNEYKRNVVRNRAGEIQHRSKEGRKEERREVGRRRWQRHR